MAWAAKNGLNHARLRTALHVELCDRAFPEGDESARPLNRSQRKELQRLAPLDDRVVEDVVRWTKLERMSVRMLRQVVDDHLGATSPVSRARPFAGAHVAARFEMRAFLVIEAARDLFADRRAVLERVQRGSDIPADFVLRDGTGLLAAFECKAPSKGPQPRRMLELAAVLALLRPRVPECYAVLSDRYPANIAGFQKAVEVHGLVDQHLVVLSEPAEASGSVTLVVHRHHDGLWEQQSRTVVIDD